MVRYRGWIEWAEVGNASWVAQQSATVADATTTIAAESPEQWDLPVAAIAATTATAAAAAAALSSLSSGGHNTAYMYARISHESCVCTTN